MVPTRALRALALALPGLLVAAAVAAGVATAASPPASTAVSADSIRYATTLADINQVGLTVTNYGFFGTNFNSRAPSFEYPLGTGYEHMSRAGLWVGALALSDTGVFYGVSSAIVDNSQGSDALAETEFTPAGTAFLETSRIANSPVFSPTAVSDQDLVCLYSDRPGRPPRGRQGEVHRPLQILVRQRTMGFSLAAASSFVIPQLTIVNQGPPLRDVYVGLYVQLVSGDKNAYATWPPSASSPAGSWYYKTHSEYDAARRLYKERYCAAQPYPGSCNTAYCPPWASVKVLRVAPDAIADKKVSFHWWSYSPGDTLRDTDRKRYALMSDGVVESDFSSCVPGTQSCSPIMLLSVGPWAQLDPGDSIRVDFAFVGGMDEQALLANADFAQFTSDIDYRLPAPPPSPRLHVETGDGRVDLYWDDSPEQVPDPTSPAPEHLDFEGYRVYLGLDRLRPSRVAQFDRSDPPHDTVGFNTGLDGARLATPRTIDGVTYRYRFSIPGLKNGFNYFGGVTSYDLGDTKIESLESGLGQNKFQAVPAPGPGERAGGVTVFPNPYRVDARWDVGQRVRDHYLWFANLPPRCMLRVYTLAGDRVFETRFEGAAYRGEGARGLYDPRTDRDVSAPFLSGASYAWDMITREGQAVATGLYLFSVEDLDSGHVERGKFLIVKSDRED
jgi:hypothetical protein